MPAAHIASLTSVSPRPGWLEHDAAESWAVTQAVAGEALHDAGVREGELDAVGVTNQRETVVVWDPASGEPLARAIVWQDRRTAARCDELRDAGHEPLVRERTGLVLEPHFTGTKIEWLLGKRRRPARARPRRARDVRDHRCLGDLQVDRRAGHRRVQRIADDAVRHLAWRLGRRAVGPVRGARACALPAVVASCGPVAVTTPAALHGHAVPVAGIDGDQQAALFGQACVDPGLGKNTYGTGSFVLQNAGPRRPETADGLSGTVAWRIATGSPTPRGVDPRHRRRGPVATRRARGDRVRRRHRAARRVA